MQPPRGVSNQRQPNPSMCTTSRYGPIAGRVPLQRLQYVLLYRTCCTHVRAAATFPPPAGISLLSLYLAQSDMVLGSSANYRCRAPRMMPSAHTAAVVWAAVYYMHKVRCTVLQSYATRLQQSCRAALVLHYHLCGLPPLLTLSLSTFAAAHDPFICTLASHA